MTRQTVSNERLLAYAADELDAAMVAEVEAALRTSAELAATVARYRAIHAILRRDDSVAPPAAALARAKAIFGAAAQVAAPAPNLLELFGAARRVAAKLTFDSGGGLAPVLAGFRGGDATRQLVFEADGTVVDLQLEPPAERDQRWHIIGQVDAAGNEQGLVVGLAPVSDEGSAIAVTTDAHGGFHLSALAGSYNIFVRVEDSLIFLPDLVIG